MSFARDILRITKMCEEREIFWHGTHLKALRKILKTGFDHREKRQRIWGKETGGLESYPGNYFTKRLSTAIASAHKASHMFGGPECIVEVQLETRTSLHDEDNMQDMKISLKYGYSKCYPGAVLGKYSAEGLMNLGPKAVRSVLNAAVEEWLKDCDYAPSGPRPVPQALERLKPLLYRWAEITLKKVLENGESFLHSHRDEGPEYRELEGKILGSLRGSPARRKQDVYSRNVRVDEPVTFSGSNKILSAVVLPFQYFEGSGDFKRELTTEEQYGMFVLYGTPSWELEEGYQEYVGGEYEIWNGNFNDLSNLYAEFGISPYSDLRRNR